MVRGVRSQLVIREDGLRPAKGCGRKPLGWKPRSRQRLSTKSPPLRWSFHQRATHQHAVQNTQASVSSYSV